jgi:lipopolysaccharide export LptBFGC system permease protein LptF
MRQALPTSAMLGSLFFMNSLKSSSELIAYLSMGNSLGKLTSVVLPGILLVAALQFANLGYIAPAFYQRAAQLETNQNMSKTGITEEGIWIKGKNYFGSFNIYDHEQQRLIGPKIYFYNPGFQPENVLEAKQAIFVKGSKSLWAFYDIKLTTGLELNKFHEVHKREVQTFDLGEGPDTFKDYQSDIHSLDFFRLYQFLKKVSGTGINLTQYYLELYSNLSQCLVCIVLGLIPFAFPMGLSSRAQSSGKSILLGLILSILVSGSLAIFQLVFTSVFFPPVFAALTYPMILLCYLIYLLTPKVKL